MFNSEFVKKNNINAWMDMYYMYCSVIGTVLVNYMRCHGLGVEYCRPSSKYFRVIRNNCRPFPVDNRDFEILNIANMICDVQSPSNVGFYNLIHVVRNTSISNMCVLSVQRLWEILTINVRDCYVPVVAGAQAGFRESRRPEDLHRIPTKDAINWLSLAV